ncbi:MAG: glycosyltransferase [Myxococcales bacterium]|nr:glycosyltransferase [Myxococcales bacterium]
MGLGWLGPGKPVDAPASGGTERADERYPRTSGGPWMANNPDLDLTAIVACRDDDEHAGHTVRRIAAHLRQLGLRSEILAVDEGSADNTLALLALVRREVPELEVVDGAGPGRGFIRGAELGRGRALLLIDARTETPLSALGLALRRIADERDAVAVGGRYLVLHRMRTLRAHESLLHRRDPADLERRFLRRARALGLAVDVPSSRGRALSPWARLRESLLAPLASRV